MDPVVSRPPLGAVALVGTAFRVAVAQFGFLFPLAFAGNLVLAGLDLALAPAAVPPGPDVAFLEAVGGVGGLVLGIALTVLNFAIGGVLCLAAIDAMIGKRHALADYIAQTVRHLWPMLGIALLLGLATGIAATLLVVPALYIVARFLPWMPAVLFENLGWSGVTRAQELTQEYRWPLVGSTLIMAVGLIALFALMTPLAAVVSASWIVALLIGAFFSALALCVLSTYGAAVYLRLREIKDGDSLADVAASID